MLFGGNEMADADPSHSMFGKTPMDWTQLDREPGCSRHALVRVLAALRRDHPVFTDASGDAGLTWLDTTAPERVTAFVRRNGRETILVVQNWSAEPVSCDVSFHVPAPETAWYLAADDTDRDVRGTVRTAPLHARGARLIAPTGFELAPWGCWVGEVAPEARCAEASACRSADGPSAPCGASCETQSLGVTQRQRFLLRGNRWTGPGKRLAILLALF